jgi:hypothetical protein
MTRWQWLLGLALLAGCASSNSYSGSSAESAAREQQSSEYAGRAMRLDEELTQALSLGAPADCDRACSRKNTICALADRICQIAAEEPANATLAGQCRDARARCERAQKRVAEKCACSRQL